jgi:hypothetical protein
MLTQTDVDKLADIQTLVNEDQQVSLEAVAWLVGRLRDLNGTLGHVNQLNTLLRITLKEVL